MSAMHRPIRIPAACVLLTFAAFATGATFAGETEETVYGSGLSDDAVAVSIGDLLTEPDRWVDKKIRVEGKITDVCPKMGCWVDIVAADGDAEPVRFKVEDGVIEFPMETKGHPIVAVGTFVKIEMDRDQALAYARHEAEERGIEFDADAAELPTAFYRIEGDGAIVRN